MLFTSSSLMEGSIRMLPLQGERAVEEHQHDFLELVYIHRGRAEQVIAGSPGALNAGDYLFVDYGTSHSYRAVEGTLDLTNCLFLPEAIDPALCGAASFEELVRRYFLRLTHRTIQGRAANRIFHDGDGRVGRLLREMTEEFEARQAGYLELLRCGLTEIIVRALRRLDAGAEVQDPVVRALLLRIRADYARPLRLETIAEELSYSLPYLSARFRQVTGLGFRETLQRTRIEESCRLLLETDRKVSDIAQQVGYGDARSFVRLFRRLTGLSPREFRRKMGPE